MNLTAEQAQLDRLRDQLIMRIAGYYMLKRPELFSDWKTYFEQAYKNPNDAWVRSKSDEAFTALQGAEDPPP